jgi:hypothetical protein
MSDDEHSSSSDSFNYENVNNEQMIEDDENEPEGVKSGQKLLASIRHYLQYGLSREKTFRILDRSANPTSAGHLSHCFKHIDTGSSFLYEGKLNIEQSELAMRISNEYIKIRNGISIWPNSDTNCNMFRFLDSRYAPSFVNHHSTKPLYLLDNFHGQKR